MATRKARQPFKRTNTQKGEKGAHTPHGTHTTSHDVDTIPPDTPCYSKTTLLLTLLKVKKVLLFDTLDATGR